MWKIIQIFDGEYGCEELLEPFMGSGVVGLNLAPKHAVFI